MIGLPDVRKSTIASRTSCTLPHSAAVPVGRMMTPVTRLSTLALRSASVTERTVGGGFEELAEDAARLPLLEVTADLEHEGRVGPHRRPAAPGHEHQGNEAGAGYRDSGHDENENEHNAASYSHVKPPVF